tara:strand:- start:111 stop:1529 length:1419 start_codon:yes stop_codon:yes gene_type:complete
MEGLHHDTVLDVPRSVSEDENQTPVSDKKEGAVQEDQEGNTVDKSLEIAAPKESDGGQEQSNSDNMVSSEGTDSIPKELEDAHERELENVTLTVPLANIPAEDSADLTASNEEPTLPDTKADKDMKRESPFSNDPQETNEAIPADDGTGKEISSDFVTLHSEKAKKEDNRHDEESKTPAIKELLVGNESTTPESSNDLDAKDETLIHTFAEGPPDSKVSKEEETLCSENSGNADKPQLPEKTIRITKRRKEIAVSLLESKAQIPHFYLQSEINAGPLLDTRKAINEKFSDLSPELGGFKITINDLVLKASSEAISWVPEINASWEGDHIKQHSAVHLAFSVAVEDGLITPVIHDAETKHLRALSVETRRLISKARTHKLSPEEMRGSTFTVTNLGMYGIDFFSGIINPPNAAILSVGASKTKPIVDDFGKIVSGRRIMLGLSCDHRVVDGAIGSSYLKALTEILENPTLMMV